MAAGSIARRAASVRRPWVTAAAGARGVVGTLSTSTPPDPSSSRTTSVNVPPMSTPRRKRGSIVALRRLRPAPEADGRHPQFSKPVAERRAVAALHVRQAPKLGVGPRRELGEQLARLPGGRRVRHVAQVGEGGEFVVQANREVKGIFVRFRPPLNELILDAVELCVELSRRSRKRGAGREPFGPRHPRLHLRPNVAYVQHGVMHLAQLVPDTEQEVELLLEMRVRRREPRILADLERPAQHGGADRKTHAVRSGQRARPPRNPNHIAAPGTSVAPGSRMFQTNRLAPRSAGTRRAWSVAVSE